MKSNNRHQKHSNSNSHSPSNRSRSREKEREREKEKEKAGHNRENDREKNRERNNRERERDHNNKHQQHLSHNPGNITDGKLYLTNIPINFPDHQVKEEFERYGKVIDYSLKKKLNIANPYKFGYITLSRKQEAEKAREAITKNFSWYVAPFDKDGNKDKNNNKNRQKEMNNNRQDTNFPVREILVKNLPPSTTEANLYKEFFIYGEISKIELKNGNDGKKYAFIKYRLMDSAIKAYEEEKNNNFNGNVIKVSFSNIAQRKDIKGNEEGYELNENNCKLILITFDKDSELPNEEKILQIFENFGKIKNYAIKNNKNCIYIEYYKPEEAKKAIEELNKDVNSESRKMLGDEKVDINFYFKTKSHEINFNPFNYDLNNIKNTNNNMNMLQNNNLMKNNIMMPNMANMAMMNNPIIYQFLQKNLFNNQFNLNTNNLLNQKQNINTNISNQSTQEKNIDNTNNNSQNANSLNKLPINNQLNNLNISNNPLLNTNYKNQIKMPFPFINSQMYPMFQGLNYTQARPNQDTLPNYQIPNLCTHNMLLNNPNLMFNNNFKNQNNNMNNNINNLNNNYLNNNNNNNDGKDVKDLLKKIMDDKNNQNKNNSNNNKISSSDSDISSLNGSQSAEEMDFEKEYSLEEENLKYIWNGFLTKNNKDRVNVDLYQIRGKIDDSYFNEYHLNICNRIQYEEVIKRHLLGIVAISPQNVTQREIFDEYVNYLDEKQRCGVINVSEKYILYLASPGEFSRKFYQNPKKHLLGLLVDATVEPNLYVDMNNLPLPPPVISLTEKRRLLSKSKKAQNEAKKDNKILDNKNEDSGENLINIEEIMRKNPNIKETIEKLNKKDD
jgi:RNA recognition motif-containing protein